MFTNYSVQIEEFAERHFIKSFQKKYKTKFKVAGTQESAKTSGNRCIVAWNQSKQFVSVLLVYTKTDLSGTNETAEWIRIIKNNYPSYKDIV